MPRLISSTFHRFNPRLFSLFSRSMSSQSSTSAAASSDFWSASHYLRFSEPRTRPGLELIARVKTILETSPALSPRPIETIADLGCGTGRFVPPLAAAFPSAKKIYAVDSSQNMLENGREWIKSNHSKLHSNSIVEFELSDISNFLPSTGPVDFLYSNAAFHWLPNHKELFPKLIDHHVANQGGIFAIQIPNNFLAPSHTNLKQIWTEMFNENKLNSIQLEKLNSLAGVLTPEEYYSLLYSKCQYFDLYEINYYQTLEDSIEKLNENELKISHPVCSWVRGSILSSVLPLLGSELNQREFLERYVKLLHVSYPTKQGINEKGEKILTCVLPFKRIFMIGIKK